MSLTISGGITMEIQLTCAPRFNFNVVHPVWLRHVVVFYYAVHIRVLLHTPRVPLRPDVKIMTLSVDDPGTAPSLVKRLYGSRVSVQLQDFALSRDSSIWFNTFPQRWTTFVRHRPADNRVSPFGHSVIAPET